MLKWINIIAIGAFIVMAIVLIKMKPVYEISTGGEIIGYIQSKKQFEKTVYEMFNDNKETNIAFADFHLDMKFKLVEKEVEVNEEKVIVALRDNADITYFQYAIFANGEEKAQFSSMEQANEVLANLEEKIEEEVELRVERVYTKALDRKENIDIASMCDKLTIQIKNQIKEEQKREKATIEGVYIAVVPVQGNITSRYGAVESVRDHEHKGLDIATKMGTPIKAAADGTVTYSGTRGGYGNLIIMDHGNGITTYYGHCSKRYKKEGETVKAGDVIAAVGSTGNSTGPHLHFEIRRNGVYVNPAQYLFEL